VQQLDARARMTRMTNIVRIAAVFTLAAFVGACAGGAAKKPPTGTPEPDKFLYDRGTENLGRKRWIVAREYFRQLVDSYPQSPYRADAKLGIGDTYMGEKSAEAYVLAINEFREFLSFYPTSKRAHEAQYKLAMAHFNQMKSAMRDQTETRDAIREFQNCIQSLRRPAATHRRRETRWPARPGSS
jgi:outer membrane assembly lipoprotein YfiO